MNSIFSMIELLSVVALPVTTIASVASLGISIWALKTKSYRQYNDKKEEFEKNRKKIKEDIDNDKREIQ